MKRNQKVYGNLFFINKRNDIVGEGLKVLEGLKGKM